jgi:DnaJ-class molecular chaperone
MGSQVGSTLTLAPNIELDLSFLEKPCEACAGDAEQDLYSLEPCKRCYGVGTELTENGSALLLVLKKELLRNSLAKIK